MGLDDIQDGVDSKGYIEVPTKEWYPSHKELEYPKEFVDWINSINSGWQNNHRWSME